MPSIGLDDLASALPPLRAPEADAQAAEDMWRRLGFATRGPRVVALHPGSGGAAKCWLPARFAELARRLRAHGYAPLLIEGPQDAAAKRAVLADYAPSQEAPAVAHGLSVAALAALLARCVGYVGNDSGVAHIAGMLGIPTLALFGPSDPAVWTPLGARAHALRSPTSRMEDVNVTAVERMLVPLLAETP
jgi:ADP-heptose:LPS heptosyltransferase